MSRRTTKQRRAAQRRRTFCLVVEYVRIFEPQMFRGLPAHQPTVTVAEMRGKLRAFREFEARTGPLIREVAHTIVAVAPHFADFLGLLFNHDTRAGGAR